MNSQLSNRNKKRDIDKGLSKDFLLEIENLNQFEKSVYESINIINNHLHLFGDNQNKLLERYQKGVQRTIYDTFKYMRLIQEESQCARRDLLQKIIN